ncbi:ABC transporter substrate-binding protein [Thermosipho ferrireducens]|uniref:ABC transporter substrate-binding protein n=1 Tax=Thermosipho ferrireducens TaxID=2571116 RepID=A0ABX7S4N7_9BACT|nr:ABC transporter substrate-binding protein [Thermosipho ferrireducens]QTA37438.1 ABC transporter substrate-binding protein [Thermosipho ferrireducens]
MRKFFAIFVLMIAVLIVAEIGVYPEKVVIGSFQALSGPYAIIGQEMTKGMKAYFNWINNRGGLYGRKIELIVADDQLNPSKTVVEVKRLVEQDKVFAIVGGLGTYGCLAVMDYLNEKGVPFVYQGAGTSKLVVPPKKYIFGVQPDYTLEGHIIGKYLIEAQDAKKIAILYMNNDIGIEGYNAVKDQLSKYGIEPAFEVSYNPLETDYSAQVLNLLDVNPEFIVIYGLITDTIRWIKTIRDYGLESRIITIYPNADPNFIRLAGDYAEGIIFTGWVPLPTPDKPEYVKDFERYVRIFQETYPDQVPSSYAAAGFIAAEVFVEGLLRAGENLTRETLVKALESFDHWSGILAKDITWNQNRRRGKDSMYLLIVKDGTFTPLTELITWDGK